MLLRFQGDDRGRAPARGSIGATLVLGLLLAPSAFGYDFVKTITIDRNQIPGTCAATTLGNYPMLFKTTDPDLAHTSSGGSVTDIAGDDIVFRAFDTATCGGPTSCTLDHEIERYNPATGELIAWVRIPSVNTAAEPTDSVIQVFYGDSTVTTPTENPTGVWTNYAGVWHLEESAGTRFDSTSNANHGIPSGNVAASAAIVANGQTFDGSGDFITIPDDNTLSFNPNVAFSVSAWVFVNTTSRNIIISREGPSAGPTEWDFYIRSSGQLALIIFDGRFSVRIGRETSADFPTGAWHHVTGTYNGNGAESGIRLYIDGVLQPMDPYSSGTYVQTDNTTLPAWIGAYDFGGNSYDLNGRMDELRLSRTRRNPCWVAASYRNQIWPDKAVTPSPNPSPNPSAGFYSIGAATAVELTSFGARGLDGSVELSWETGSELENLGFQLYRSTSVSGPYERITSSLIPGLGSSPEGARYRYVDSHLENGVTYFYELEDVETTGRMKRHGPVSATPAPGVVSSSDGETEASGGTFITYGDPEANELRVSKRGPYQVVLELTTAGFVAHPEPDGSVRIAIPDYVDGESGLPVRKAWIEAVAGRQVELVSVRAEGVERSGLRPSKATETEAVASRDGVVRLRPARGSVAASTDGARVEDVAFQGDVKKALVEMSPLSWDASRGELRLATRLHVTLSFGKRDANEAVAADGIRGRRERGGANTGDRDVVARLTTTSPGLHAVAFEAVFSSGGSGGRGVPVSSLRLSRLGALVPFHVEPAASRFARGSTLFFVSEGAEANPYGNEAVFELELDATSGESSNRTMTVADVSPSSEPSSSWYARRDEQERDRIYQAALMQADDPWVWDALFAPVRKAYPFRVDGLATSAPLPGKLEVWLQGGSDFPASPDHHVRAWVNGTIVGERSWNGKVPALLEVAIAPGVLREGENRLEIENVGDTEALYSMVYVDRFAVSYARQARADDGVLLGRWHASGTASLQGFSQSAFLLDVTDERPAWLDGAAMSALGAMRFDAESGRRYLVVDGPAVSRPVVRKASRAWSWLTSDVSQADLVVLGPRAFVDAALPLIERRREQGLTALGVPLEGVYEIFGFGESRPEAIRDFLSYAYHHWRTPSLRYVLLLGDGTYDFKNVYGLDSSNRVPPLMIPTQSMWTASDPTYAAVNGDDRLPDVAIGRLPASSLDELRGMVAKILAYESGGDEAWEAPVVLVSDDADAGGNFAADARRLAGSVLASESPRHISLEALGTAAARNAVREAFDDGAYVMSYVGHGGIWLWADENLLDVSGVARLSPQEPARQPLLLTMNCLNGYFHFPFSESLSEALVSASDRGAIAAFSPSGLSLNAPARRYHEALLNELFHGGHERLGDAVMAAQAAYADTGALPELLSIYHVLGDPTLMLAR